jgi:hypothetical protein
LRRNVFQLCDRGLPPRASNAVLTPDELLADKSLFLRKSRRDLVEVRKAFVFADRRRQLVANDCGYHVDLLPVTKINSKDNKLGGWKTELLFIGAYEERVGIAPWCFWPLADIQLALINVRIRG